MASLVIRGAEFALSHSENLLDHSEASSGTVKEKNRVHWSYKVLVAGSIIGAIVTVASLVMQAYAIVFAGAVLTLTNGVAAFYIKKLGVLKTLEGYTSLLTARVQKLAELIIQLKETDKNFQKTTIGIENIPNKWALEIENGKKQLKEKTRKLEEVTKRLEQAQVKLEKFSDLSQKLQKQTGEISNSVLEFSNQNKIMGNDLEIIKECANELNKNEDVLDDQLIKFDEQNDQVDQMLVVYQKQNKIFESLFNVVKQIYNEAKIQVQNLSSDVKNLNLVIPKAHNSTMELENLIPKYEEISKKIEEKTNRLKLLKESMEYKEFINWKKQNEEKK